MARFEDALGVVEKEMQSLKNGMAEKVNDTYQQNVVIDVDENTVEVLDIAKLGVIFYIVEEAIANARKHAQADHIWVRLKSLSPDLVSPLPSSTWNLFNLSPHSSYSNPYVLSL